MIRKTLALVLACCLLAVTAAPPARAGGIISPKEERKLGKQALQEVLAQLPLVDDPDSVDYLRHLGQRLVSLLDNRIFDYHFYLANEPQMNAFALPGGWIFVFRGMFTEMKTEDELAAVIAHEISHVHYRHIAKRIKKTGPVQAATIAGMIAGLLLGALAGAPQLGQALTMGSMAGGIQTQLAFSREDEMQADYGGYQLMSKAGYDPRQMATTFEKLWRQQRYTAPTPPVYLLTHPTSPQRMEAVQNLVRRHPVKPKPHDNRAFLRIRTRLIALYDPTDQAHTTFVNRLRANPKDGFALYGLALVEMRRLNYRLALRYLNKLEPIWKGDPYLWREMGLCHLDLGEYQRAEELLGMCLSLEPKDALALLGLGRSYLRQGKLKRAEGYFHRLLASHPHNAQGRHELGVTLGRMGRTAEASYQLGLGFKEEQNYRAALYHLTRAVKELKDPVLKKKAGKVLAQVKKLAKKQAARRLAEQQREPQP